MQVCQERVQIDGSCGFIHCENLAIFSDDTLEGIRECLALPECMDDAGGDVYGCIQAYDCG